MARTVGIGHQDFGRIISEDIFYIDKTLQTDQGAVQQI